MSGIFKSIGKIFGKIIHTVIEIAPYALAAAAVIFTGGAALGLLPAFSTVVGGLVGSLGLSAAVTGALTGAITSAGFGAALGFITGGKKGIQQGALFGALSGGVLGAINPATFGIVSAGSSATSNALAGAAATGSELPTGAADQAVQDLTLSSDALTPATTSLSDVYGALPSAITPEASSAAALGDAAQAGSQQAVEQAAQVSPSGGIAPQSGLPSTPADQAVQDMTFNSVGYNAEGLPPDAGGVNTDFFTTPATQVSADTAQSGHSFLQNLLGGTGGVGGGNSTGLIGSILQSIGKPNQYKQEAQAEVQAREQLGDWAYGGAYTGHPGSLTPMPMGAIPQPRYYYDKATNTVVDRQQGG